ncbi:MAG: hypothetical protein ABDH21_05585 [bacterium]
MIDISYFQENNIHGDDSYFIHKTDEFLFVGLSDGVSSNRLGKVCSYLAMEKIHMHISSKNFIENLRREIDNQRDVKELISSILEISLHEVMEDFKQNKIPAHFKEIVKQHQSDPKGTILIGIIDLINLNLYTYSLGDSECWIIRNNSLQSHTGYLVSSSSNVLTTYFSLSDGIVGNPDISSRKIYNKDIIVFNTDGAKVTWTSKFGVQGVPFLKNLYANFTESAPNWIKFLKQNNLLQDDATLVIVKIQQTINNPTDKL